ncbi:MAG: transketolase [Alphaproteobacteria bacterium]|nr:transketolase [Alphaproteobacteria bacterium]
MANAIRALSMDAVQAAKSGHPGMPMGMADVATVLFTRYLKFDPSAPDWPDRDRFILSAGHGSMLLYSLLYLCGYSDITLDELKRFRQLGARTAGHPEYGHAAGIEMTTGPLGQGLATAVGMALAERMLNARFGDDLVDHYTYTIAGDGCLMEGISHEAIDFAGNLKLAKLIVLFDDNQISIDGATSLATSMDQPARFRAADWDVVSVDGHDEEAVSDAIKAARANDRPSLIACKTIIGFGAPNMQGTAATHGAPLGEEEIAAARKTLGCLQAPFDIPEDVLQNWRKAGARGHFVQRLWAAKLAGAPDTIRQVFKTGNAGNLPTNFDSVVDQIKKDFSVEAPKLATRQSSQKVLDVLMEAVPMLVSGSADLTGSNGTKTKSYLPVSAGNYAGNYIHYGVREHAMAAAMNGIALHGRLIPLSGTFLAFADYSRGAIRLGALMGVPVVHVMTHDSIGLGEDGPTHQPVEHLASLRAIPNLNVFRPADAVEVAETWALALKSNDTPSVLCLTRQGLRALRTSHVSENLSAKGAYVIRDTDGERDITLLASGSEVEIAIAAADMLGVKGIEAAVVSMPCWELFASQSGDYRARVLGTAPRVGVEAACGFGWEKWIGCDGVFVGMTGFGASAPASDLFRHFNITSVAVADAARALIEKREV